MTSTESTHGLPPKIQRALAVIFLSVTLLICRNREVSVMNSEAETRTLLAELSAPTAPIIITSDCPHSRFKAPTVTTQKQEPMQLIANGSYRMCYKVSPEYKAKAAIDSL